MEILFSNPIKIKPTILTSLLPFILLFIVISYSSLIKTTEFSTQTVSEFGANLSQLIELRGYKAFDHYVTSPDGYILNLVEVVNPAIYNGTFGIRNNHKDPILFIHGSITNGKFFVINSIGSTPKNYENLNISSLSREQIHKLFQDDPTTNSLPLLASNFGHSVWILNRRGGYQSQGHVNEKAYKPWTLTKAFSAIFGSSKKNGESETSNLTSFKRLETENYSTFRVLKDIIFKNPKIDLNSIENQFNQKYWNYSLDDEARFDIPASMNHVLDETGKKKLSLVGHSAGSNLIFMVQILYPELQEKSKFL